MTPTSQRRKVRLCQFLVNPLNNNQNQPKFINLQPKACFALGLGQGWVRIKIRGIVLVKISSRVRVQYFVCFAHLMIKIICPCPVHLQGPCPLSMFSSMPRGQYSSSCQCLSPCLAKFPVQVRTWFSVQFHVTVSVKFLIHIHVQIQESVYNPSLWQCPGPFYVHIQIHIQVHVQVCSNVHQVHIFKMWLLVYKMDICCFFFKICKFCLV